MRVLPRDLASGATRGVRCVSGAATIGGTLMPLPWVGPVTFAPAPDRAGEAPPPVAEPRPLRSFTVRYVRPGVTLDEVEAWCESVKLAPCRVEGPCLDGTFRGTCLMETPEVVHDGGAAPAAVSGV